MSYDWDEDKGFIFSEGFYDGDQCPMCQSYNTSTSRSYENSDRDGNRGHWVEMITCHHCGYDERY